MDIAIMIEGQNGLTWPRWQRMARAVEDLGFAGLYRSDHFTNAGAPDMESLELWTSLTWLASNTKRIEFGPLVTPCSFRHPAFTARMGKDVDDLSGGRLILGVGAGWQEREHTMFNFPLLDVGPRMDRFQESLAVISGLLRGEAPVSFDGAYYTLREAQLLPRAKRAGGPPLLIGGNGERRTLPLTARYADEWNGVFLTPQRYRELNRRLDELVVAAGRAPGDVKRSLMTGLIFGRTNAQLQEQLNGRSVDEVRARGVAVGTPSEIADVVGAYADAGAYRIMLQWMNLDDFDGLEALAKALL